MPHSSLKIKEETSKKINKNSFSIFLQSISRFYGLNLMLRSIFLLSILCIGIPLYAQSPLPGINISIDSASSPQQVSTTLQIVFLLTVLTMAPAILIMTTSFTRFVIVLSFLRQAIGTPTAPSNQIVIGNFPGGIYESRGFAYQTIHGKLYPRKRPGFVYSYCQNRASKKH